MEHMRVSTSSLRHLTQFQNPATSYALVMDTSPPQRSAFISYAHEPGSSQHTEWVARFAADLRANGVDAILDLWDVNAGGDINRFMDSATNAASVIIICTPRYRERAESATGGVGRETVVLSEELFTGAKQIRFIPVLRTGDRDSAIPRYLRHCVSVDGRANDRDSYLEILSEVLRGVFNLSQRPKLGTPPTSAHFVPQLSSYVHTVNTTSPPPVSAAPEFSETATDKQRSTPIVVVADVANSSRLDDKTRTLTLQRTWEFLSQDASLGQVPGEYISGCADRVIACVPASIELGYEDILDAAVRWVGAIRGDTATGDIRVALNCGDFVPFDPPITDVSRITHGPGVNACERLASVPEGASVIASDEFVNYWHAETGRPLSDLFYPKDPNRPIEIAFSPSGSPQRFRLCTADGLNKDIPTRLEASRHAHTILLKQLLPALAKDAARKLSRLVANHTAKELALRVSLFAPVVGAAELRCTEYRVIDGNDSDQEHQGVTRYPIGESISWPLSCAYTTARVQVLKGLPEYKKDPRKYVAKCGLGAELVDDFGRHARTFIGIPVGIRQEQPTGVLCVDVMKSMSRARVEEVEKVGKAIMDKHGVTIAALWEVRVSG